MEIFYVILGFIMLLLSGNWLVKAAVSLATHFNISALIIGVTIVSIGTSAPELFVSLQAAIGGFSDIATGNVIGSNIANIALVLALTCLVSPLPVQRDTVRFDWPVMMGATILFFLFALNGVIERWEGFILLIALIGFILFTIKRSKKEHREIIAIQEEHEYEEYDEDDEDDDEPEYTIAASIVILVISVVGLVYGSKFLIVGAGSLALKLGVSERIVSITVIAFGTSIPELATSLVAAIKKQPDISVGNLIGSNIFNILAILGITTIVKPININPSIIPADMPWLIGIAVLLGLFLLPAKKSRIQRWKGLVLLVVYFTYFFIIIKSI
jgi:cation:H+ antiporter